MAFDQRFNPGMGSGEESGGVKFKTFKPVDTEGVKAGIRQVLKETEQAEQSGLSQKAVQILRRCGC